MGTRKQLKLGVFLLGAGHHLAAWRHPLAWAGSSADFGYFRQLALTAERGKLDAVFFADNLATLGDGELASHTAYGEVLDPLVLLTGLAAVTTHVGLVGTLSTTFNAPYLIARRFGSLDQVSGGRAGWNLVTSALDLEAQNFGQEKIDAHAERYARAEEAIDIVQGLWDSFADDAFVRDKAAGRYFDPAKLRSLDHSGKYYPLVRGPLNLPRSPQGQPVVVQAGSSEAGIELAARTAEVVFTAQQTLQGAQAFYNDLKGRLDKYGRTPEQVKILPGLSPVLGATQSEAEDLFAELQELIEPQVGLALLAGFLGGFDLSSYPLDGPLPQLPESNAIKSRQLLFYELARRGNLSIRQLYLNIAGARGHKTLVGTPTQVADLIEEWFSAGAVDGFNIMPPILPHGLEQFVDQVVPELQRRGLFRNEYEGRTLRENLGLARPPRHSGG